MTTSLTRPTTTGRHRAPETDEPRWASATDFLAAWRRVGRHAAPSPRSQDAAEGDADPFDWLGFSPAAS